MYHPYIYEGMLIREIKQELNLMQSLPSRESTFILALSRLLLSQIQIPHHLVSEIFKIMCQPPTTAIPNHHQAIGDKLLLVVEANTADVTHTRPRTIPVFPQHCYPPSSPSRSTAREHQLLGRRPQQILTRSLQAFCTEI